MPNKLMRILHFLDFRLGSRLFYMCFVLLTLNTSPYNGIINAVSVGMKALPRPFGSLEKVLMFFGNSVPKKPENKREGISPNYNNPQKGYALRGTKRFLSGSLGFLFFLFLSPRAIPMALIFRAFGKADKETFLLLFEKRCLPPLVKIWIAADAEFQWVRKSFLELGSEIRGAGHPLHEN